MKWSLVALSLCACLLVGGLVQAQDGKNVPGFRNADRSGGFPAQQVKAGAGLKQRFKVELGAGFSAPAIVDGLLYCMGNDRNTDTVWCLDAKTGQKKWTYTYPCKAGRYRGPRSTPTVDEGLVFTVSREGQLFCFDRLSGALKWRKDYQRDYQGKAGRWGYAGSPLVIDDMLICDIGGRGASTVAFDKKTGRELWKSGNQQVGYSSPMLRTIAGKRTLLILKQKSLVGLDPKTGRQYFEQAWTSKYDVNAIVPVVIGDMIFLSSGYNDGKCAMFKVTGEKVQKLWGNEKLRCHFNAPVAHEGLLYGYDGNVGSKNDGLVCLDAATGKEKWRQTCRGAGSTIVVGSLLVALEEFGTLKIGPASGDGLTPTLSFNAMRGKCWVNPVVADGVLYIRNNDGVLAAYDLQ